MIYKYKLSLVIPVMNEEANIRPLIENIKQSLHAIDFEIVLVDDGSSDNTVDEINKYRDGNIRVIELMKNFGQSSAMQAGIDFAEGEYIVTMDGDLQNDPSDIPMMLRVLQERKVDMVAGERLNRQDGLLIRKIPSKIANWIIRKSTGLTIKDYGCTLKIFKSSIAKNLNLNGELHRFIPVLAQLQGARIYQVPVKHFPRTNGKSKYGLNRTFKVMSDLILMLFMKKYQMKPMHLFGTSGIFLLMAGIGINFYFLTKKLMGEDIWGRPMLLLGVILFLSGIQLITTGIIAELQIRTQYNGTGRKIYMIRNIHYNDNVKIALDKNEVQAVSAYF